MSSRNRQPLTFSGLLILVSVALAALPASAAHGHTAQQATPGATEEAAAPSTDALTVTSVDTIDIVAGPSGTTAILSPDGTRIAYYQSGPKTICILTLTGKQESCADVGPALPTPDSIRWSADGSKLTFTEDFLRFFRDPDIWLLDVASGKLTDLTDDGARGTTVLKDMNALIDLSPTFTPDGKDILFVRYTQTGKTITGPALVTIPAAGGTAKVLGNLDTYERKFAVYLLDMTPDGSHILYWVDTIESQVGIDGAYLADADGGNARQILATPPKVFPYLIALSPDGQYVLSVAGQGQYGALKPADSGVRVTALKDGPADKPAAPVDPDHYVMSAAWAPTGHTLAYVVLDRTHPDTSGLYIAAEPGKPGQLVQQGLYLAPSPQATRLVWGANNTILLASTGGRPLNVIHLGTK